MNSHPGTEDSPISEIRGVAARLELYDPGFVRTRRGIRAVGATVLAWATMVAVTQVFDVADPARITLFAAGAAFEGALLAPDPRPRDRVRTLGWSAVVGAVAVVATVGLMQVTVWLAAGLLVVLMFSSYALKSRSPRVASLALIGAITVYITGGGHITVGRIGWFVLALMVGLAWLALWESAILPDRPLQALRVSVQAFSRRAADTVVGVAHALTGARDVGPSARAAGQVQACLKRVRSCRGAIERQLPGVVAQGVSQHDIDRLRVAVHSVQKGLDDMVAQAEEPQWMQSLPDDVAWSIISTLQGLADALRNGDEGVAARRAEVLRGHLHEALARTDAGTAPYPPDALLAASTLLAAAEVVAQSVAQATQSALTTPSGIIAPAPETSTAAYEHTDSSPLSPTMALAIQAVVAPVAAGLIAKAVGNEQSLVVAWTAFVVIAGSAGLSRHRAWIRTPATLLGAIGGVAVAACVPDALHWTVIVVAVGVFFTIVTAPVSYPAMVFWMSIAFVPLFATEGRYLDLIWDKSVAALIGGCVAAVVTLTIAPIRSSREVRPAVLAYLDALDAALAAHLPGRGADIASAEAELDAAHAALAAKVEAAATETNLFSQPRSVRTDEGVHVDAVHELYLRLTPLLSDTSRRLHGWTDDRVEHGIRRLRGAVSAAKSARSGDAETVTTDPTDDGAPIRPAASVGMADSLRRIEQLHATLMRLASVLDSSSDTQKSILQ